jgi:ppGpp synthetase/RelA/SpoT-type nucleotidyltranferase
MTADYSIRDEYAARFDSLTAIAERLQKFLKGTLDGIERIDSITARAKNPDRYFQKAVKVDSTTGDRKYSDPKHEIQDQVGARITVFYLSDVEKVRSEIVRHMRFIEEASKSPLSDSEFGYFGLHFILSLPEDVVAEHEEEMATDFFELQIKTLFQHAWSEAHHDLGYKSLRDLTTEERRKVAFTAAQAWGADTIFEELSRSLGLNDNEPQAAS